MAGDIMGKAEGPLWKPEKRGPKPPKPIKTKTDYQWAKTRKAFLEGRQNHAGYYTCDWCRRQVRHVDLHHITGRRVRPDLKYEPSNLVAICHKCHTEHHGQKF